MKICRGQGRTALVAAFIAGLLTATAVPALAGFGKTGWERFGALFQQGYVAGFIDAVRLAKSRDPDGYLTKNFKIPAQAKAIHWAREVTEMYAEERFEKLLVSDVLQAAGDKLSIKLGPEAEFFDRGVESLRAMTEARHRAMIERFKEAKENDELVDGKMIPPPPSPMTVDKERLRKARAEAAQRLGTKTRPWPHTAVPRRKSYVLGFTECLDFARLLESKQELLQTFPSPRRASVDHWNKRLMKIYGPNDEDGRVIEPLPVAMAWVGRDLAAHIAGSERAEDPARDAERRAYLKERIAGKPTVLKKLN